MTRNDSRQLARACARIADDKKGKDINIRDVRQLVGISEYFVLVGATNRRQAQAIADGILKDLPEKHRRGRTEGYSLGWWILMDFGAVVVHILQEEARSHYGLDHLWADAPRLPLSTARPRGKKAKAG